MPIFWTTKHVYMYNFGNMLAEIWFVVSSTSIDAAARCIKNEDIDVKLYLHDIKVYIHGLFNQPPPHTRMVFYPCRYVLLKNQDFQGSIIKSDILTWDVKFDNWILLYSCTEMCWFPVSFRVPVCFPVSCKSWTDKGICRCMLSALCIPCVFMKCALNVCFIGL